MVDKASKSIYLVDKNMTMNCSVVTLHLLVTQHVKFGLDVPLIYLF